MALWSNQIPADLDVDCGNAADTPLADLPWNLVVLLVMVLATVSGQSLLTGVGAAHGRGTAVSKEQTKPLVVEVDAVGAVSLNGRPLAPATQAEHLAEQVRAALKNAGDAKGRVWIVPDQKCPWQTIVTVRDVVGRVTKKCTLIVQTERSE